jgi:hypothetical protein
MNLDIHAPVSSRLKICPTPLSSNHPPIKVSVLFLY